MIHRIFSDLPSFKELQFRPGLNVLVAEKSAGATEKQTRNGAGKTSVIEIIHFLTGAKADPKSLMRNEALVECSFGMELDLLGSRVRVLRSGTNPSRLIVEGKFENWAIAPSIDRKTGQTVISNANWKRVLAAAFFGLQDSDAEEEEGGEVASPTFRSTRSALSRGERDAPAERFAPLRGSAHLSRLCAQEPEELPLSGAYGRSGPHR